MNPQRYTIHGEGSTYIRPDNAGKWVKWEDVEKIVNKEVDAFVDRVERAHKSTDNSTLFFGGTKV